MTRNKPKARQKTSYYIKKKGKIAFTIYISNEAKADLDSHASFNLFSPKQMAEIILEGVLKLEGAKELIDALVKKKKDEEAAKNG